ncbi:MAG TPA: hypothetical protein VFG19_06620 [Geobacteraceae bacterium]|nr:hypothetical protein [Geobacteraceae bacterium]
MTDHSWTRILIFELFTIALLTIFGCLFSFFHEIGYYYIFKIPSSLLRTSVYSINIPMFILATYGLAILALSTKYLIFNHLSDKNKLVLSTYISIFLSVLDILLIIIFLFFRIWNLLFIVIVLLLGVIFGKYLSFYFFGASRHQLSNKNTISTGNIFPIYTEYNVNIPTNFYLVKEEADTNNNSGHNKHNTKSWARLETNMALVAMLTFLCIISSGFGIIRAVTKEKYYVVNTSPEMVVLRIYGNVLICAPFDRISKKIYKNFDVKNINDFGLKMTLEKIGPLSMID